MLPDRVSNPGPLTYESGALPIASSKTRREYNKMNRLSRARWSQSKKKVNDQQLIQSKPLTQHSIPKGKEATQDTDKGKRPEKDKGEDNNTVSVTIWG